MDIDTGALTSGFIDPTRQAQQTFRIILEAMIHPGRILRIRESLKVPDSLDIASAAACLTLLDFETKLWTDSGISLLSLAWLRFHCGCPIVSDPAEADLALIANAWQMPSIGLFAPGDDEYPERSATLIVQVDRLSPRGGRRLRGPGIDGYVQLDIEGVPENFWEERQAQSSIYPLGVDIIFVSGRDIAALPRTTIIENRICT